MAKQNAKELRQAQKQLIDEMVLHPEKMEHMMLVYMSKMHDFHNYTLSNLLLANWQLMTRTGESIEVLAPYKKWQKKGRQVRRGEKALYVLAPRFKKIEDEETGEVIDEIMWFDTVPVFDLSQTDGEPLERDYTINNLNICFNEIKDRIDYVPINETSKQLKRGYTDGKEIWVSKYISDTQKICVLIHELTHYKLHFGKEDLTRDVEELEAEVVSYMVASAMGITNDESSTYIKGWAGENAPEIIKGRGQRLIDVAVEIMNELKLTELVEEKNDEIQNWKQMSGYLTSRFMQWDTTMGVEVCYA